MTPSDVNKKSDFSSTNMNLSEPVRFLIFIVKDIPKMILKAPFVLLFSFERFYLWDVAKALHFIIQLFAFIAIMRASQTEIASIPLNFFGIESPFILWLVTFVIIRAGFELLLVLLGIHRKLSNIVDLMDKEVLSKHK